MRRAFLVLALSIGLCASVYAQGVVGDLLAGKLVNPKVGQWAWYDLKAKDTGNKLVVRQAIVGEEKVGATPGYWVEFEIVPEAGYKLIYKMLLTGPASDVKNIRKAYFKHGPEPVVAVSVSEGLERREKGQKRKSLGLESVTTIGGAIKAEHFSFEQDGQSVDLWVNERVPPTGIVRLQSPSGDMVLRSYGVGGQAAASVIAEEPTETGPTPKHETKVTVTTEGAEASK